MAKRKVIDLSSGKEGVWFDFFYSEMDPETLEVSYSEPIKDGPRAKIRNPAPFFQERAENQKTEAEMVYVKKARSMQKVVSTKELTPAEKKAEHEDYCDYVIQDLEGFKLDGKVIRNTKKDKVEAMKNPLFAMYVNRCIFLIQKESAKEEEEEGKN
jgi:hypothetical protein